MNRVVLLGPQRHAITVTAELPLLASDGRVAAITAGWQEREAEDDELQDAIGHRAVNLELHRRTDEVFAADRELFEANRGRQDKLRQLQEIYRIRLGYVKSAVRELMGREGSDELMAPERAAAMAQLRELDQHHLGRLREVHAEFEARWAPLTRPALAHHHEELRQLLADCSVVAIAGGHVATLLGRIRLLGIDRLIGDRAVMAWSAGAMVCTERVVLFHDRPPEGAGNAEILDQLWLVDAILVTVLDQEAGSERPS